MKKSLVILISIGLIVLLSVSFVSASWFGDFWKKITGRTTENETNQTGCTDECSTNGNKQCSGSGYQTCGEYDSDSCLEWSSVTSCPSSETCVQGTCVSNTYTCTDSDGGKDYNIKGNVLAKSPTSDINVWDLCSSSSVLIEYFCTNLQQSGETYTCPNGCSNGACVSSTTNQTNTTTPTNQNNICTDSDGGKNYNVKGTVVTDAEYTDFCNTGTNSNVLTEYFCTGVGSYTCPNGCSNGACISSTTTNQTGNASATSGPTTTSTSTTTTSTSGGGGGGGGGSTSSKTSFETPAGFFEETINIEEKIEEGIKITTESKKITDESGNKVEIEIKTEIKEDGTTIIEEKREFTNKEGKLIKLKFIFENDGENIKIKREIGVGDGKIESELEISEKFEEEEIKLKAKLSDGSEREIKIMPDRASEIAIEKLKTKNFEIELKEVGEENALKVVYIVKVDEDGKFLDLFKVRLKSEAQIDGETGEIINLKKQWWNFLVAKIPITTFPINDSANETNINLPPPINVSINQTNLTNITLPLPINQTNISFGNQTNLTNITLPPSINWSINYTCTDSDGGKNYSIKGNVLASSPTSFINVTDLCSSSSVLVEYFCTNLQQSGETYTCPNGCSNGACI